jgi:hypothetical protein
MRRRPSGLWMVINRSPWDQDLESATTRFEAGICSRRKYLHPQLLAPAPNS